jgi:hypothetical protein
LPQKFVRYADLRKLCVKPIAIFSFFADAFRSGGAVGTRISRQPIAQKTSPGQHLPERGFSIKV